MENCQTSQIWLQLFRLFESPFKCVVSLTRSLVRRVLEIWDPYQTKSRQQTTPGVIFHQTTFNLINQGVSISTTTIFHLYNPVIRLIIIATIVDISILKS